MSDNKYKNISQGGVLFEREHRPAQKLNEPRERVAVESGETADQPIAPPAKQPAPGVKTAPKPAAEPPEQQADSIPPVPPKARKKAKKQKASNNSEIKEVVKWSGKTDPKNLYSEAFLYSVLSVLAVLVSIFVLSPRLEEDYIGYLTLGTVAAVLLFAGIFFVNMYQEIFSVRYKITPERIFIYKGIFTKRIDEIEMIQVRDIRINQDFFQRIFGLGDIIVYSGDDTHPELLIEGIKGYYEVKELIRDLVNQMKSSRNMLFSQSIG